MSISRRSFLKASATVTAAAYVTPVPKKVTGTSLLYQAGSERQAEFKFETWVGKEVRIAEDSRNAFGTIASQGWSDGIGWCCTLEGMPGAYSLHNAR